jgi:hypothetical protein
LYLSGCIHGTLHRAFATACPFSRLPRHHIPFS